MQRVTGKGGRPLSHTRTVNSSPGLVGGGGGSGGRRKIRARALGHIMVVAGNGMDLSGWSRVLLQGLRCDRGGLIEADGARDIQ